ncbi:MAG: hypothetical protein KJZ65_13705 [Phycisphaerales bacterium]|nr:hypothetical protein [Phycisphaerales bacterium]
MRHLALTAVLAGFAGVAGAAPILSFGYTDLSGSFNLGTWQFNASASDTADLKTSGDVTRLVSPFGTANFDTGFVTASAFADVQLALTVSMIDAVTASGVGNIVLTDDDGDTIFATIAGEFSSGGSGIYYFTGLLSDVGSTGTEFNGTHGGSFDLDLPGDPPYWGAIVQLFIVTDSGFFAADFEGVSVQVSGEILPSPGSMALLATAGLLAVRRRKI